MECLVIGAEGSGKSLFVNRIKEIINNSFDENNASENTIPTVGVELNDVIINGLSITLREAGAAISSRWNSYLPHSSLLIFIIDISDQGFLPSALVLLHEMLVYKPYIMHKPVLIVLNKTDCTDVLSIVTARNFLELDELQSQWQNIDIIEGTCIDGTVCFEAIEWIENNLI
jgi:GTPase SAR1 family protein